MTIILDAMGSDQYPEPEIQAAIAITKAQQGPVILVGNEDILRPRMDALNTEKLPIRVVHAPDMIEMGDKPVENTRKKSQNSMAIGLDLLKSGEGQAFVTAGNTGAAMFNALLKLGRIRGILRPALTAMFPTMNGHCVVLDIGANAECKPEFLQQFALMGSIYAEKVLGINNPRVGLLSNGEEAGKGNLLIKETYPLLESSGLNFLGNVESKELFGGQVDVVVTDGFTGNVLLKTSESVAKMITTVLKQELKSSLRTKAGALLAKDAFGKLKKLMDPGEVGAAPLLGIDGLVFVGHGRSDARSIINAVLVAQHAVDNQLLDTIRERLRAQVETLGQTSK